MQAIQAEIENGEYFINARNYYADRYYVIKSELVANFIILIISIIGSFWIVDSLLLQYSSTKYFFVKYFDNQVDFISLIKPIIS